MYNLLLFLFITNLIYFYFEQTQGIAIAQLSRTVDNITIFGSCSKGKHEVLKETGLIDHLLERGTDYCNEVRK